MRDKKLIGIEIFLTNRGYDAVLNEYGPDGDSFNLVTENPKTIIKWLTKHISKLRKRGPIHLPGPVSHKGRIIFNLGKKK